MLEMNHIHEDKEQLESTMELLHPNWKREVVAQQYLPKITVVHDFPHIDRVEKPGPIYLKCQVFMLQEIGQGMMKY